MQLTKSPIVTKKRLIGVGLVLLALLAAYFVWDYIKTRDQLTLLKNPEAAAKAEADDLAKELGRYMVLPSEAPSIATVSDPTQLRDQPFFANTQKDDKVLVFAASKKALLYRPSIQKIIEYATVTLADQPAVN